MTGCAERPPRIELVRQGLDPNLTSCAPEPVVPAVTTEAEAVRNIEALRLAGEDCRSRLACVRRVLDGEGC